MRTSYIARKFVTPLLGLALACTLGVGLSAGCTQVREAEHSVGVGGGVPKNATKLAVGTANQGISTTSPRNGTVFLNDEDTAEVIYTGKVSQGDSITLNGANGTFVVGSFKKDVKLSNKDTYAVYVK